MPRVELSDVDGGHRYVKWMSETGKGDKMVVLVPITDERGRGYLEEVMNSPDERGD